MFDPKITQRAVVVGHHQLSAFDVSYGRVTQTFVVNLQKA
jgi:hypothetical protein